MTNSGSLIGQRIGNYKVTSHLATGGMAEVFLADDVGLRRQVVLKMMLPQLAANEAFIARFQREARTTARLNHPNIIQVYSTGLTDDGRPYIAMQYVRGGTLHDKLTQLAKQSQLLPTRSALEIIRQVADALSVAHAAGIVHRDLKPSNILLHPDGKPIVTDMGIAAVDTTTRLTRTGEVMGTPYYMSPEQAQGKPLDGRSDIYSLGVILYETLAGNPPFQATSPLAVLHQHIYEPPPQLLSIRSDLTQTTNQVVEICLRKNPDQRYQNAKDLVAALDGALAVESGAPPPAYVSATAATVVETPAYTPMPPPSGPTTQPAQPEPSGSKRWLLLLPLLLLLLLLCAGAGFAARGPLMTILNPDAASTSVVVIGPDITETVEVGEIIEPTDIIEEVIEEDIVEATAFIELPTEAPILETSTPTASPLPAFTSTPSATPIPVGSAYSGQIVFNSNRDGDHEIYMMEADGSNQRQLTLNSADDEHGVISPDGRKIAFETDRDGNMEVYVMNIDGSNETRLTNNSARDRLPTWSPDGSQIAFISERSGNRNIHIMNADGSNQVQITNDSRHIGHPSWSVNNEIVFNAGGFGGSSWEIYVLDLASRSERQLTDNNASDWSPEWSPDGQQIAYLHSLSEADGAAIYIMDAFGNNQRQLYNSADYDWGQDWSPDGRRILFTREIDNFSYIYIMNADGSNATFISDRGRYPKEVP